VHHYSFKQVGFFASGLLITKFLEFNMDHILFIDGCFQQKEYHLLEGHHWVTEHFLSLPPGCGTVCR